MEINNIRFTVQRFTVQRFTVQRFTVQRFKGSKVQRFRVQGSGFIVISSNNCIENILNPL